MKWLRDLISRWRGQPQEAVQPAAPEASAAVPRLPPEEQAYRNERQREVIEKSDEASESGEMDKDRYDPI